MTYDLVDGKMLRLSELYQWDDVVAKRFCNWLSV